MIRLAPVGAEVAHRVEHHLGTAVSVAAVGATDADLDVAFARIAELEGVLSRFRPHSALSRYARGALARDGAPPALAEVLSRCEALRSRTEGCFEHEPGRVPGAPAGAPVLDTDGFAKGWIVDQAALALRLAGVTAFVVNAGGDVVCGAPPPGRPGWRVGVRHPRRPDAVVAVLELADRAVATSGCYERGPHIRSAGGGTVASATVVGPELGDADALATAVLAAGAPVPPWWDGEGGEGLLTVGVDGRLRWTAGLVRQARLDHQGDPTPR